MGLLVKIENDGRKVVENWCSAYDWPNELGFESWEDECARRKTLLVEEYGYIFNEYGDVEPDETQPHYYHLMNLVDSNMIDGLEEVVEIVTREIPTPQPGEMYKIRGGNAVPYSESTLFSRLETLDCAYCRMSSWGCDYEAIDDDGNIKRCCGCYQGFFGRDGVPDLPDDFALVLKWNEQGQPCSWRGCASFEWD